MAPLKSYVTAQFSLARQRQSCGSSRWDRDEVLLADDKKNPRV